MKSTLREPDQDIEAADELLSVQTTTRRRGRPLSLKPSHRQPPPPSDTRGESWWTKVRKDESMTEAARGQEDRLKRSRVHAPDRLLNE